MVVFKVNLPNKSHWVFGYVPGGLNTVIPVLLISV